MDSAFLKGLYRSTLRLRLVEERVAGLYQEKIDGERRMRCPVHLSTGQEAAAVGVCAALGQDDRVFSGHRSHAHYLAKGADLKAMLAELYGKATGCAGGRGGSMHLVDLSVGFVGATPIVGSTIPIAVGAALASQMRKRRTVAVAFFGEAATEEGVFHESVNFAVLRDLPVVFACENNLYSVYSPVRNRQPEGREVYRQAASYGLESHQVDGNDAVEVYHVARAAVDKARTGRGPTFLELMTYRWRAHVGPFYDNDAGYRTEAEFACWKERDPVERLERRLVENGAMDPSEAMDMTDAINAEIDEAVAFAKSSPFPEGADSTEHLYSPRPQRERT